MSARGVFTLDACLADGAAAGDPGGGVGRVPRRRPRPVPRAEDVTALPGSTCGSCPPTTTGATSSTCSATSPSPTCTRATGAGLRSVEHVKRYTTAGTAHDQGKTSGVLTSGVVADAARRRTSRELGTTTFRPPYRRSPSPPSPAATGESCYDPVRVTSLHEWHVAHGAPFENVGQWKRPWYYPRAGEDMEPRSLRECAAAREGVGDDGRPTLGKIDVQGRTPASSWTGSTPT